MDTISQILQAVGYLLLLVILIVLWNKAVRQREWRNFWMFLALAWTMNLFGNIAWVIHDLVTGTALSTFSVVDVFYVMRYVLIGLAFWLYPVPFTRRAGIWIVAAAVIANVLVWAFYFRPAMTMNGGDWVSFLGLALYPILDAAIITLVWLRVRAARGSLWYRNTLLLFCAMTSYGIANTLNLTGYVFSIFDGLLPNVFWILTDVFLLVMALGTDLRKEIRFSRN
jgi:hypothetical protein